MLRQRSQPDRGRRRGPAAPRVPELIATAVWVVLAVWAVRELAGDSDGFAGLVPLIATVVLGLPLAGLWLARMLVAMFIVARSRKPAVPSIRWLPLPAAIGLVYLIPGARLADTRFLAHRTEFDGLVATVRSQGAGAATLPLRIGEVTIRSAWVRDDCVFLCIERSPDGERGFAHSPASPPPTIGDWVVTQRTQHLEGPWYRYSLLDE